MEYKREYFLDDTGKLTYALLFKGYPKLTDKDVLTIWQHQKRLRKKALEIQRECK